MREIKFRAWDKESKRFTNYALLDDKAMFFEKHLGTWKPSTNRFTLMQYTGLKDKNGKEIYEGDIVKTSNYGTGNRVNHRGYDLFNIIFKDGAFRLDSKYRAYFLNDGFHCEIIGNIYENPELMEVSNDK